MKPQIKFNEQVDEFQKYARELKRIQREESRIGLAIAGIACIMIGVGVYFYFQI